MKDLGEPVVVVVLSLILSVILYYPFYTLWKVAFPDASVYEEYANPVKTAAPLFMSAGTGLLVYWLVKKFRLADIKDLIIMFVLSLFAYLFSLFFYYNMTLSPQLFYVLLTYMLYVPYWAFLGGLIGGWVIGRGDVYKMFNAIKKFVRRDSQIRR